MSNNAQLSISGVLSKAYQTFTTNLTQNVIIALSLVVVELVVRLVGDLLVGSPLSAVLFLGVTVFVWTLVSLFLVSYSIIQVRGTNISISEILKFIFDAKLFINYVAASLLVTLLVSVGFMLLIVPGIILGLGLMFTYYIIVDKNLGPIEAMKESWNISKGYKMELFLLFLAVMLISFVLGLTIILAPFAYLYSTFALAAAYDILSSENASEDEEEDEEDADEDENGDEDEKGEEESESNTENNSQKDASENQASDEEVDTEPEQNE